MHLLLRKNHPVTSNYS